MIEFFTLFLTILAFLLATYEDIKKKEIYDYLNFLYVFSILLLGVIDSLFQQSLTPITYVGFGLLLGFLLGSLFYLLGMWGGGDAKFLMGFGASSYYLLSFISFDSLGIISLIFQEKIVWFAKELLSIFSEYVVVLNCIILVVLFLYLFLPRSSQIKKEAMYSFIILSFLTLGLYLPFSSSVMLFVWGFLAFLFFFFSSETLPNCLYKVMEKKVEFLKKGDIVDRTIKIHSLSLNYDDCKYGLNEQQILKIQESSLETIPVRVRFPLGIVLSLNFALYGLLIISINSITLSMMVLLLVYLFFSFMTGGIIAIGVMMYLYVKNPNKKKVFSLIEQRLFLVIQLFLLVGLFFPLFFFLYFISLIYFLFKFLKSLESSLFFIKKPISKIVPGDWIVQDIVVKGKTYFKKEHFSLGVDEFQLDKIRELAKQYSIKSLLVKEGIAFMPSLFVAFIVLLYLF